MRASKIILICGLAIILAVVCSAGYLLFLRPLMLPVYHLAQRATDADNFVATSLSLGTAEYVSGASEVALEMTAARTGWNARIGKTDNGMDVYAIPQQDPQNYILLTTFMFPYMIFRNANLPPIELAGFQVDEIQLLENLGDLPPQHQTRDAAIIAEVKNRLMGRAGTIAGVQTQESGFLRLISERLPGIAYIVYVCMDGGGRVFLAEKLAPDDWIPAGPAFTDWFQR